MVDRTQPVRVAVVQAAPVLYNREATVAKAARLILEAGAGGARLVLLPEAFIPAYPRGLSFGAVVGSRSAEGRQQWQQLWEQAVEVPGPDTDALGAACREAGVVVAVGLVERAHGTLYCTLLFFGPDGQLLGKHRKLKPTGAERLIWGEGNGSSLTTYPTAIGRIGGLICWENYMPLARTALYAQGVELYLAPTADARETWQATLQHIACEGRCFVLSCNQFVTRAMYPPELAGSDEILCLPEVVCRGGSAILSPFGELLAGPVYDREETLFADLDLNEVVRGKFDFDVAGHYSRPDVFQLRVNGKQYPGNGTVAAREPEASE
jgi:nitrilase